MKAASQGHIEICTLLLGAKCDPYLKDVRGYTADKFAEMNCKDKGIDKMIQEFMTFNKDHVMKDESKK